MNVPIKTNRILMAIGLDLGLTLLSLWLSAQLRLVLPFGQELNEPSVELSWPVYVLTAAIWLIVLAQFNLYSQRRARYGQELAALTLAVLTALLILAGALYLSFRQVSRLQFIYFGATNLIVLSVAHTVRFALRVAAPGWDRWRVLIVGAGPVGRNLAQQLREKSAGVTLVGFLDEQAELQAEVLPDVCVMGRIGDAARIVGSQNVSELVLALPRQAYDDLLALVAELEILPVQVSLVPDVLDLAWFITRVEDLNGIPLLRLRESPLNGPARAVKRVMDIGLGSILLAIAMPVMFVIGLLIKADSPGPVLIRQHRVGENGRLFGMLKFRTMWADEARGSRGAGEPTGEVVHKRRDDPRVTRLGRILRRYSLDELPQLLNVLSGEMSLVGPRPELPWLVDRYETWQRRRFAVPPGMTGWWQVNGRSDRPMHLNVEDDLYYIRNYSLWLDVVIMLKTLPAILGGRGAY